METKFNEVNDYINSFTGIHREMLLQIRNTIKSAAPESEEAISYGMPAFKLRGKVLVYFAGYKNHIGFYATPSGHSAFANDLSIYKQGKGSVQFPVEKELPLELVARIVEYRVNLVSKK